MGTDRKILVGTVAVFAVIVIAAGAGLVMAHEEDTGEEGETGGYCHDYDHDYHHEEDHHRGGHHHGGSSGLSFSRMFRRMFPVI